MKAIIYCRKSTDRDDMQAQSLDTQITWAISYCQDMKIDIVETIIEAKSAKEPGRDGFNKMMMLLEKGIADTIVTMHLDRLTRNAIDEGTLKWLTQNGKIKQIHCKEGVFDGSQVLMLSIHFGFSNQYLIDLKKKVIEGIDTKIKNGGIVSKTPLGYINNKETRGADVDQEAYNYIIKIFELRAEGNSFGSIAEKIKNDGFRSKKGAVISTAVIERTIKNPFYYGMMIYKDELIKGKHESIISKDLWDKANSFGRGVIYVKDKGISELKGLITNYETGDKLCTSLVRNKYVYFHTHGDKRKSGSIWINQNEIIKYFDENIHLYCIPEKFKESVKKGIFKTHNSQIEKNEKQRDLTQKKIDKLNKDKNKLIQMRKFDEITSEEFIQEKNKVVNEIEDLNNYLVKLNKEDGEILEKLTNSVELYVELNNKRKSLNTDQKVSIIKNIAVELKIDNQKRLHIAEKQLFKTFREINYNNWWS